jgi:S1-C subfamily serine protease
VKSVLRSPFVSALIGGLIVGVVVLVAGVGTNTKTVTQPQQATLAAPSNASDKSSQGLTPNQIYKQDAPGVVYVRSTIVQQSQSPFNLFPQQQQGQATGSGIVIDKKGTILTNWHVVQGAIKVTVQFGNQNQVSARVVGTDPSDDLALLRIATDGLQLSPLPLGDSSTVQVGDPTLAIGNPFGLDRTLTTGVVSALQRQITAPNGFTIAKVIQTDAPINPGNSGGPLLNAKGQVIGINSQIETGGSSTGSVGIGFAVPINTAKGVIPQLERSGKVQQAYLGLVSLTIDNALSGLNLPVTSGALVQTVQAGTPADKAGIHGGNITATVQGNQIELGGDIITAINGQKVASSDDLANFIGHKKPGDTVTVTLRRGAKTLNVSVKLGSRPNSVPNPNTPQG